MMGIRHSTDSVRVRIVLTAMENTSRDLTGGVPLGRRTLAYTIPLALARRNAPQNAGKLPSNGANFSEFSDPDLISGSVAVCNRGLI